MGCIECGKAYSMVFGVQFHRVGCAAAEVEAKLERAAQMLDETVGVRMPVEKIDAVRAIFERSGWSMREGIERLIDTQILRNRKCGASYHRGKGLGGLS